MCRRLSVLCADLCLCVVCIGMCAKWAFVRGSSCASYMLVDLCSFASISSPRQCLVKLCVALYNLSVRPDTVSSKGGGFESEPFLGLPRLMVVGLSYLQTHGISSSALVSRDASSSVDPSCQGGPNILYSVFCILYSEFCIYSVFCTISSIHKHNEPFYQRGGPECKTTGYLEVPL